ncbi:MAG: aldo/keto reductase [Chloroflexi bacterium]|nr:aldo/keto reductase [Chloroflexota bacterium]
MQMSRLVAGVWRLMEWQMSKDALLDWIHACLDLGLTTFDNADIYGGYRCEAAFGEALALQPALRGTMEIVTKCGIALLSDQRPQHFVKHYNTSRAHIVAAAENSLRQMRTDYIDLLLIHRPDPLLNADETAAAFVELKQAGKVLHFGVSNFTPSQFDLLQARLDFPLVTNQIEFSVLHLQPLHDGTLDHSQRLRLPPMAWSPLGGGSLFTGQDAQTQRVRAALEQVGRAHGGAALDTVALAWLLAHPAHVVPVLGSGKVERLRGAAAAEQIQLDRQQWFSIWQASAGHEVP